MQPSSRAAGGGQDVKKRRISRCYSVEADQDAAATWEESSGARKSAAAKDLAMPLSGIWPRYRSRLEGGEQGVPERATKSTAAEELAPVLGEIAEKS